MVQFGGYDCHCASDSHGMEYGSLDICEGRKHGIINLDGDDGGDVIGNCLYKFDGADRQCLDY